MQATTQAFQADTKSTYGVLLDFLVRNPFGVRPDHGEMINDMVRDIHERNVAAGWWTDRFTGESLKGKRNMGELLCLVHSEADEGFEGYINHANDDHLPQRPMLEVELADILIRVFDIAGGFNLNLGAAFLEIDRSFPIWMRSNIFGLLLHTHAQISKTMEGHRKGLKDKELPERSMVEVRLAHVVNHCFEIARNFDFDLPGAFAEKLAYNATREDHKLENRRKAGGKAY